jgi:glc operon protein GlcG
MMTENENARFIDRKGLSLSLCQIAMDAALNEAAKRGLRVTVAILDAGGILLNLSRMDLIHAGSVDVAMAKARCAVMNKVPTKFFSELYDGGLTALPALPGILPFEGGVPILLGDDVIGAIGVSGATPDLDGIVASAGVDAILSRIT